jgi:hypothetical protein
LARVTKVDDSADQIDWLQCLGLFQEIPSIELKNLYFCSYNSKSSIENDPIYQKSKKYKDRIIELNKNGLIKNMLTYLGIWENLPESDNILYKDDSTSEKELKRKIMS